MAAPGSNRQRDKLGERLIASSAPDSEDLAALHELLQWYGDSLDRATPRMVASTGLTLTSRVKNTGTIREKLRRNQTGGLSSIQDLAGARIVGDFRSVREQDESVNALVLEFSDAAKSPRTIDRRARPSHGYRAVHVIVYPDGAPVEIQVRSQLQHDWAERFEKVADLLGRDVRYGGAATFPGLSASQADDPLLRSAARHTTAAMEGLSGMIAAAETRGSDQIGRLLALRDRWLVAQGFTAVEATVSRLEMVLASVALTQDPFVE